MPSSEFQLEITFTFKKCEQLFRIFPNIYSFILSLDDSLHSKRFRGVGEQRKTKERNRNGIMPAFFAPEPHGNACYAGYLDDETCVNMVNIDSCL